MLFNSYEFIFVFLPIVFGVYWLANYARKPSLATAFLVLASLVFYAYWDASYLPLILFSLLVNFYISRCILGANRERERERERETSAQFKSYSNNNSYIESTTNSTLDSKLDSKLNSAPDSKNTQAKIYLIIGICFNLALLGFYKYTDFVVTNLNAIFGANIAPLNITLPIGISFFTFTQIAFLADAYARKARAYSLTNYALFITYFPHLLAGPILHHGEILPQFEKLVRRIKIENLKAGITLFSIGLLKKVVADFFAPITNAGFANAAQLNLLESWVTSLSYTLQLYFDFSAYTDMALGLSLLFGVRLPLNFASPYKAANIQDFWRRWHITLGRFLRDYIYIPLGGARRAPGRIYFNLFITFFLGGVWHGAGWSFIIWGALHGGAMVLHRAFMRLGLRLWRPLAWLLTFNFVNIAWVFFRAENLSEAISVIKAMFSVKNIVLPVFAEKFCISFGVAEHIAFGEWIIVGGVKNLFYIAAGLVVCLCFKNSNRFQESSVDFISTKGIFTAIFAALAFGVGVLSLSSVSEFLYFNF